MRERERSKLKLPPPSLSLLPLGIIRYGAQLKESKVFFEPPFPPSHPFSTYGGRRMLFYFSPCADVGWTDCDEETGEGLKFSVCSSTKLEWEEEGGKGREGKWKGEPNPI